MDRQSWNTLHPVALLSNGRIWYLSGNNGILSVRDTKSGKLLVEGERLDGVSGVYASPVSAGGRVYIAGRKALFPCSRTAPNGGAGNQRIG
ncbi:MAG: hypothetical protein Ct9H300mP32_5250 [Verrucomicrobiota bacterium]|nr:MAG: hypothetical protein Ct9H300mP32_5250 [Verrucomicrobiota bacterium]